MELPAKLVIDNIIPRGHDLDCFIRTWNQVTCSVDYNQTTSDHSAVNKLQHMVSELEYLDGDDRVVQSLASEPDIYSALACTKMIVTTSIDGENIITRNGTAVFITSDIC